jgi:Fe-S oxidoreductase
MRGVAEGRIPLAGTVAEEAQLCLGCRACETACPAGVEYGSLLEHTRAAVDAENLREGLPKKIETLALRQLVPRPGRLHWAMNALALVQRLGLDRLARPLLPKRLREMHALLPAIPPGSERGRLPALTSADGERRGRVAVFEGCIMPEMFGRVNAATVRVLAACGLDVASPKGQGCCGALQAHSGDLEFARALARTNLSAFDPDDFDALVVNSAGCGASLREVDQWLPGDGDALAAKVRDVSEVIVEAGIPVHLRRMEGTVCYDDPCHLVHGQGVSAPPRALLEAIPGLEIVQHDDPGSCCGAAGIYNLTQPEMSRTVLSRKMDALEALDPDYIATGNPGCMMQLATGARERGLRAEVVHPVELLDRALSAG